MIASVPTLTSARFTLRPMQRGDAGALLPTLGDEAQCRYLAREPFSSEEQLWNWLAAPEWPGLTWIAQDRKSAGVAGRFVAVPGELGRAFEIGYITCADRQGEGIARECTATIIAHLTQQGARRVTAEVDARNVPSIRLLESLGFHEDTHLRNRETTHSGVCDVLLYGVETERAT